MCQIDSIVTGLKISVGHGHWSDPFVKLSDVARKPPDILSDKSETGVYCLSDPRGTSLQKSVRDFRIFKNPRIF